LRSRIERKIRKRLRSLRHQDPEFVSTFEKHERSGASISSALRIVMFDPGAGWYRRGTAAKVLALADAQGAVAGLLDLFFTQTGEIELWETALTIEHGADRTAVHGLSMRFTMRIPIAGTLPRELWAGSGP
jgi:hypothetical protein